MDVHAYPSLFAPPYARGGSAHPTAAASPGDMRYRNPDLLGPLHTVPKDAPQKRTTYEFFVIFSIF